MAELSNSIDRFNGLVASLAIKAPCAAVAIANITLSGEQTVNGVAVVSGDRVLVIAQTSAIDNGIYDVSSGAWARAADFDGNRDVTSGTFVTVATATVGRNPYYQITTANPITIGTTAINFTLADGPNVSYALTPQEIADGLTDDDIDDSYEPGVVLRYGVNTTPKVTDMTTAINTAIRVSLGVGASTANTAIVPIPSGGYLITSTIEIPSHIRLIGAGSSNFGAGETGSEIIYGGPTDGGTDKCAIITAADDDSDWSRGGIERLKVTNSTATANDVIGVKVRNPQNGSYVKHLHVSGFPGGGFLSYEPSGRTGTVGATPAVFYAQELYCSGGIIPVDIECGGEPSDYFMVTAATDSTSTMGMRISKSPQAEAQRSTISIRSSYVEHGSGAGDIPGFVWGDNLPITWMNCHVHHNGTSTAEASWKYTATNRSLPTASFINCTSWKMALIYNFVQAGVTMAPTTLSIAESFSAEFNRPGYDVVAVFADPSVSAGLSAANLSILGDSSYASIGLVVPIRSVIVGWSYRLTTPITAENITITVHVNNSTFVTSKVLTSADGSGSFTDRTVGTLITSSHVLEAGDRVTMQISSHASFTPTGLGLVASVFLKHIP